MQLLLPSMGYTAIGMCLAFSIAKCLAGLLTLSIVSGVPCCAFAMVGVSLHCCRHVGCKASSSKEFYECGYGSEA